MSTPLILFISSGALIILILMGTHWRLRRGVKAGNAMVSGKFAVVQKVDEVIGQKTSTVHQALVSLDGKIVSSLMKQLLHKALVVVLHALHELRDLTHALLEKLQRGEVRDVRGEPSQFLRDVNPKR